MAKEVVESSFIFFKKVYNVQVMELAQIKESVISQLELVLVIQDFKEICVKICNVLVTVIAQIKVSVMSQLELALVIQDFEEICANMI